MKKVVDMCPFGGLTWEDENSTKHYRGEGLTIAENKRLDSYFGKFYGFSFQRDNSIKLAQMALDNVPIPKDWTPD